MKPTLRHRFERLALRLSELDARMADPDVASDITRYRALAREQSEASGVVERFRRYEQRERDRDAAHELLARGEDVDTVLDSLSKALTQKMLHGALAELHAADVSQRDQVAETVSRLFLRQTSRSPGGNRH